MLLRAGAGFGALPLSGTGKGGTGPFAKLDLFSLPVKRKLLRTIPIRNCFAREWPRMFDRITSDSAILCGKPIIRGTRISVAMILEWVASGADRDTILRKHPQLTVDDVERATACASTAMQNEVFLMTEAGA